MTRILVVEDDELVAARHRALCAIIALADDLDRVALRGERVLEPHADRRVIFDDEDARHEASWTPASVARGSRIVKVAPCPSVDWTSTVPPSASM